MACRSDNVSVCMVLLLFVTGCADTCRFPDTNAPIRWHHSLQEHRHGHPEPYEHLLRSDILEARGETLLAAEELRNAVRQDRRDWFLRLRLAQMALRADETRTAIRHLRQALRRAPNEPTIWLTLADIHHLAGRPDEALCAAQRAILLDIHDTVALRWLVDHHLPHSPDVALMYCERARGRSDTVVLAHCAAAAGSLNQPNRQRRYLLDGLQARTISPEQLLEIAAQQIENGDPDGWILLQALRSGSTFDLSTRVERWIPSLLAKGRHHLAADWISVLRDPQTTTDIERRSDWLLQAGDPWAARAFILQFAGHEPESASLQDRLDALMIILGPVDIFDSHTD